MRVQTVLFVFCNISTMIARCMGSSADTSFQIKLIERMNSLEKIVQHQTEKMKVMESKDEDQERTINEYKQIVTDLEYRLSVQERTGKDCTQRVDDLEYRLASGVRSTSDYKQRMTDLEQPMAKLNLKQDQDVSGDGVGISTSDSNQSPDITRRGQQGDANNKKVSMRTKQALVNAEGPVAFHAVIKAHHVDHLGLNQNIVFPDIMTNIGGGYHVQHGVIIAPRSGIYIFSTSIMTDVNASTYVHLSKNGQILANAYAYGSDQGSVTVVTQIAVGDKVWVSLIGPADTSLFGEEYDSFMGCVIMAT